MSATEPSLKLKDRPDFRRGDKPLRLVDLFAGCGGLTLGVAQAAHDTGRSIDIRLAVDFEQKATAVYNSNFGDVARTETAPVEDFFDGELGAPATLVERRAAASVGVVDVLVGGPPCQGHSNLNNHTRRTDDKNALYLRMARAAEVLKPRLLIIENVPSVVRDRHDGASVVERAEEHLTALGYSVRQRVIALADLGVAQTRRRHVLIATSDDRIELDQLLALSMAASPRRTLRWAVGDLIDAPEDRLMNFKPRASPTNVDRMRYLLDNDVYDLPNSLRPPCHHGSHTYVSMYGRLRWDEPAQTITSGYGSIGQGRYMHPDHARALTAHEAARIQGFPDYFDFSACLTRTALATMIGNAVPPQLGKALLDAFLALDARMGSGVGAETRTA